MSNTTSAPDSTDSADLSHYSPYGYIPTQWICYMFIVLFAISTLGHVGQAIRYRMWWLFPTAVLAGVGEIIGWGGRLWSSYQIRSDGFLIQITTTIISPTPLLAANFIILGRVIAILGPQYSRLAPGWYKRIFLTCDLIALIVQAAGGALASMANTHEGAEKGAKIMLGGIIFQMVAITVYVALASEFFARFVTHKPFHASTAKIAIDLESMESRSSIAPFKAGVSESYVPTSSSLVVGSETRMGVKLMVAGLCFSTLVLFIRSIYRTIELNDGWSGRIIQTQVYFNVLDGAMIVLAMYCLNFFHPGHLLRE